MKRCNGTQSSDSQKERLNQPECTHYHELLAQRTPYHFFAKKFLISPLELPTVLPFVVAALELPRPSRLRFTRHLTLQGRFQLGIRPFSVSWRLVSSSDLEVFVCFFCVDGGSATSSPSGNRFV